MEKEIWKAIEGFMFYEVSNHGRIKSKQRKIEIDNPRWPNAPRRLVSFGGGIINGWVNSPRSNSGYKRRKVLLIRDSIKFEKMVHHLVLEAFVSKRPDGMVACHNDGNGLNNYYKNLRWDTVSENVQDSIKHKTKTNPPAHWGELHPLATISDKNVKGIREIPYRRGLYSVLARQYNVAPITIRRIYKSESRM